jgi:hypothetical protein
VLTVIYALYLFVYSFVFIAHRVCQNCLPPISISPFQTKISPLQLVFVNFPTDIVTTFIPSFDSMSSCRSGVSTGYPPVFQIWTECEIKETKTNRNRLNRWFTPFFRYFVTLFSSFPPASSSLK